MEFFRKASLQHKITWVMMLTALTTLLIAVTSLFVLEAKEFKESLSRELNSVAGVIGANSKAALEFDDPKAGSQTLSVLAGDPRILSAALYSADGQIFATYESTGVQGSVPPRPLTRGRDVGDADALAVFRPIIHDGRPIGTIYIRATDHEVYERLISHAIIAGLISTFAALIAYFLSARLGNVISRPILSLSETAKIVSRNNTYSIRARKESDDETGLLVDQFNEMLEEIEKKNEALETRVKERTKELEASQEQLRNTERLASIGTLAAGVAHEIRNPLNSILLAAQVALRYKNVDAPTSDIFKGILNEAKRCSTIIRNVLFFAKAEKTEKARHDLNEIVRHGADLAKSYLNSSETQIVFDLTRKSLPVQLNPTEIQQVIVNLINNAVESKVNNIQVQITTEDDDSKVRVHVADNGPGIPEENLKHIFDPFFSTKRQRGNTGLGLSLSHGIITDHNGTMRVKSSTNGTVFTIELPKGAP